jgi:SAM-dependent methyltransferase
VEPIVDTALAIERRRRAIARATPGADFLMRRVADDLVERLATVERRFSNGVALFCGTPHAAEAMLASGKLESVERVEATPPASGEIIAANPEHVPLAPESRDLIVSLLALHEANDTPGLLIQIRRALKPDGLFLAAFPGAGTLAELRESLLAAEIEVYGGASPRVMPFTDVRDAGALLQRAGFALPVADIEPLTVRYDSMLALVRDLRAMGATNTLRARSRRPLTRRFAARAAEIFAERFSDPDGRVRATFNLVWLSGWAPHETQQKPMKPGSATVSLKTVLKEGG